MSTGPGLETLGDRRIRRGDDGRTVLRALRGPSWRTSRWSQADRLPLPLRLRLTGQSPLKGRLLRNAPSWRTEAASGLATCRADFFGSKSWCSIYWRPADCSRLSKRGRDGTGGPARLPCCRSAMEGQQQPLGDEIPRQDAVCCGRGGRACREPFVALLAEARAVALARTSGESQEMRSAGSTSLRYGFADGSRLVFRPERRRHSCWSTAPTRLARARRLPRCRNLLFAASGARKTPTTSCMRGTLLACRPPPLEATGPAADGSPSAAGAATRNSCFRTAT